MNDLTDEFLRYREAARMVWNLFLRNAPDGEHDFYDIDRGIFAALVEPHMKNSPEEVGRGLTAHYKNLVVELLTLKRQVLIREKQDDKVTWVRGTLPAKSKLCYSRLYDWETSDGHYRDFQYLSCIEPETMTPVLVEPYGARILETD